MTTGAPKTAVTELMLTSVGAKADAMKAAAENKSGAMNGFIGMGMAMNAGGMNAQNLFEMGSKNNATASAAASAKSDAWKCTCGTQNTGKFCTNCGSPKPSDEWVCACGAKNTGNFCPECGAKRPESAPRYKCSKCGWVPEDPQNPPKFCPQCGDIFNSDDIDR